MENREYFLFNKENQYQTNSSIKPKVEEEEESISAFNDEVDGNFDNNNIFDGYLNSKETDLKNYLEEDYKKIEPKKVRTGSKGQFESFEYKTKSGVSITLSNSENVEIYEDSETGEVVVIGAKNADITSSKKDTALTIYNSEINSINTKKGNDTINIYNSKVNELYSGKGTDNITIDDDSEVGYLNSGTGSDYVDIKNSKVDNINTSSTFLWGLFDSAEDTVSIDNSDVDNLKTGFGGDQIISNKSEINKVKSGYGSDSISMNESKIATLKTNKSDLVVEDGNYLNFDIDKISKIESDVVLDIQNGAQINLSDYTSYIINQEVGFKTEEEYQNYTLETMKNSLESMKNTFIQQNDKDGFCADSYNYLKELSGYGLTKDDIDKVIKKQEQIIKGLEDAVNGNSDLSFEEAYKKYTGVEYSKEKLNNFMKVSNVYSAVLVGCQNDEDYMDKLEEATGKTFEEISKEFALCQVETFGKSNQFEKLTEKYSDDQTAFADKLSAMISATGMVCIVAGVVISVAFPPLAPVGMGLMKAGQIVSLTGMFIDNGMDLVDDATDKDGLTKEEIQNNALETGVEAVSYMAGRGIGKLTNGLNNTVTNKAFEKGTSNLGSKLLGQTTETLADTTLSLGADYAIAQSESLIRNGEFLDNDQYWTKDRFFGEGKNQLLGIFQGLVSVRVENFNKKQQMSLEKAGQLAIKGNVEEAKSEFHKLGFNDTDTETILKRIQSPESHKIGFQFFAEPKRKVATAEEVEAFKQSLSNRDWVYGKLSDESIKILLESVNKDNLDTIKNQLFATKEIDGKQVLSTDIDIIEEVLESSTPDDIVFNIRMNEIKAQNEYGDEYPRIWTPENFDVEAIKKIATESNIDLIVKLGNMQVKDGDILKPRYTSDDIVELIPVLTERKFDLLERLNDLKIKSERNTTRNMNTQEIKNILGLIGDEKVDLLIHTLDKIKSLDGQSGANLSVYEILELSESISEENISLVDELFKTSPNGNSYYSIINSVSANFLLKQVNGNNIEIIKKIIHETERAHEYEIGKYSLEEIKDLLNVCTEENVDNLLRIFNLTQKTEYGEQRRFSAEDAQYWSRLTPESIELVERLSNSVTTKTGLSNFELIGLLKCTTKDNLDLIIKLVNTRDARRFSADEIRRLSGEITPENIDILIDFALKTKTNGDSRYNIEELQTLLSFITPKNKKLAEELESFEEISDIGVPESRFKMHEIKSIVEITTEENIQYIKELIDTQLETDKGTKYRFRPQDITEIGKIASEDNIGIIRELISYKYEKNGGEYKNFTNAYAFKTLLTDLDEQTSQLLIKVLGTKKFNTNSIIDLIETAKNSQENLKQITQFVDTIEKTDLDFDLNVILDKLVALDKGELIETLFRYEEMLQKGYIPEDINTILLQNNAGVSFETTKEEIINNNDGTENIRKKVVSEPGYGIKKETAIHEDYDTSENWEYRGDRVIYTKFIDENHADIDAQIIIKNNSNQEPQYITYIKASDKLKGAYETIEYDLTKYPEDLDVLQLIKDGKFETEIERRNLPKGNKLTKLISHEGQTTLIENFEQDGKKIDRSYFEEKNPDGTLKRTKYEYQIKDEDGHYMLDILRTWEKVSDEESKTTVNGKEYRAKFDNKERKITITSNGETISKSLSDLLTDNNSIENIDKMWEFLKRVPADTLVTLFKNGNKISIIEDELESYVNGQNNEISIAPTNVGILEHEFGHTLDFGADTNQNLNISDLTNERINILKPIHEKGVINSNQELINIYNKEFRYFKNNYPEDYQEIIEYFSQVGGSGGTGLSEFIAETNMLLSTYSNSSDNIVTRSSLIVKHFPETVSKVASLLGYNKAALVNTSLDKGTNSQITQYANALRDEYNKHDSEVKKIHEEYFGSLETKGKLTARTKGVKSTYEKLVSKYLKGNLTLSDLDESRKAIGDGYGTRLQIKSLSREVADSIISRELMGTNVTKEEFLAYAVDSKTSLPEDKIEIINDVFKKLKEAQTSETVDRIIELIEAGKCNLTEINNYGDEISSYFTFEQVQKIATKYYNATDKRLEIVTKLDSKFKNGNCVSYDKKGNIIYAQTEANYALEGAEKPVGYPSTHMNITYDFEDGTQGYGELQMRGTVINPFADREHVPYDVFKKKIKEDDPRYADVSEAIKLLKGGELAQNYTDYTKAVYKTRRLEELGITGIKKPDIRDFIKTDKISDEILEYFTDEGLQLLADR